MNRSREEAEAELLALIRLEGNQNIAVTITSDNGHWMVVVGNLDTGGRAVGHGDTFEAAWFGRSSGQA